MIDVTAARLVADNYADPLSRRLRSGMRTRRASSPGCS